MAIDAAKQRAVWRGAVAQMVITAITAALVTNSGRSATFLSILIVIVYVIFGMIPILNQAKY